MNVVRRKINILENKGNEERVRSENLKQIYRELESQNLNY